jgi:hypothetical protein
MTTLLENLLTDRWRRVPKKVIERFRIAESDSRESEADED